MIQLICFLGFTLGVLGGTMYLTRGDDDAAAWLHVTGERASAEQLQTALAFKKKIQQSGASDETALQQFCLIMLNLNQFVYLD